VDWMLQKKEDNDDFFDKIILSDKAHFHLGGYMNKQNCRIWGSENPRPVEKLPMHSKQVFGAVFGRKRDWAIFLRK